MPDGKGCKVTYKPAGAICNDGKTSTKSDVCDGKGGCAGSTITCTATQCEASSVPNGTGCKVTYKPVGAVCNDNKASTKNDGCDGKGGCKGTPYTCPPLSQCEASSVPDGKGGCTVTHKPAGATCNDGNTCTKADKCNGKGLCSGTKCDCCSSGICSAKACSPNKKQCISGDKLQTCSSSGCSATTKSCGSGKYNNCSAWTYYCESGRYRKRKRTCYQRGCSGTSCYNTAWTQKEAVSDCGTTTCGKTTCCCKPGSGCWYRGCSWCKKSCTNRGCSAGACYSKPSTNEWMSYYVCDYPTPFCAKDSDIRSYDKILIKTRAGYYFNSAHGKGQVCVQSWANKNPAISDEVMTIAKISGNGPITSGEKIYIKTRVNWFFNSPYGTQCLKTKSTAHPTPSVSDEIFSIHKVTGSGTIRSGDKVYFRSRTGYYLKSAYGTSCVCMQSWASPNPAISDEIFTVEKL